MKAMLEHVHPFAFNALRLTSSAVVLGLVDWLERRGSPDRPGCSTPWAAIVPLALLTSFLYQILFIEGMARTSATHTGFLIASGPLWTAGIARLSGLERLDLRAWLGLGVAFAGTILVVGALGGAGATAREATLLGNALVLAAMVSWALGSVLSRPVLAHLSATRLAFLTTCIALPGHWAVAGPHFASVWAPDAEGGGGLGFWGWAAVLYAGGLSTGVAYALWNRSLLRIGPARTSAFTNLVPLVALGLAWVSLGERPGWQQLVGGALVLIGIAAWRSAKARSMA